MNAKLSVNRVETSANLARLMCRFVDQKGVLSCQWSNSKSKRRIKLKERAKRLGKKMRHKNSNMSILEEKIRQFVVKMKKKKGSKTIVAREKA